jgi:hypothetical protein
VFKPQEKQAVQSKHVHVRPQGKQVMHKKIMWHKTSCACVGLRTKQHEAIIQCVITQWQAAKHAQVLHQKCTCGSHTVLAAAAAAASEFATAQLCSLQPCDCNSPARLFTAACTLSLRNTSATSSCKYLSRTPGGNRTG